MAVPNKKVDETLPSSTRRIPAYLPPKARVNHLFQQDNKVKLYKAIYTKPGNRWRDNYLALIDYPIGDME